VTAPSVANVQAAIEHIYPMVYNYRMERAPRKVGHLPLEDEISAPTASMSSGTSYRGMKRKRSGVAGNESDVDSWSDEATTSD